MRRTTKRERVTIRVTLSREELERLEKTVPSWMGLSRGRASWAGILLGNALDATWAYSAIFARGKGDHERALRSAHDLFSELGQFKNEIEEASSQIRRAAEAAGSAVNRGARYVRHWTDLEKARKAAGATSPKRPRLLKGKFGSAS